MTDEEKKLVEIFRSLSQTSRNLLLNNAQIMVITRDETLKELSRIIAGENPAA